ncbi:hypothetical protein DH2020_026967 [Rehmannia glutinosa]|uniref:Protein kinase domain-containing protein n=1 Tax=Rehmannia glutinosa TaxID=99300 RepID=A0ABR0VYZ4_REHGL
MGFGDDGVKMDSWDVKKSKGRKKIDDDTVEETGCCIRLRFFNCCITSRSKVDSSISGISTHESKTTNYTGRDQPIAPLIPSTTTSNAESNSSSSKLEEELKVSARLRKFTFNDLKLATRNFRPESLLGEGDLVVCSKDGLKRMAEVKLLGDLVHPNLVKLIGYCIEDDQRLLAYEFMPRGSLENHLFRRSLPLPWSIRMKIALGAAKGLAFLHEEAERPVIYRDFKTSNILLDAEYNAKLSDFGFAKDAPDEGKTHVSTRVMGTYGYAAPEYVMTGHLTSKSDVYSFGVVLLEMLTGAQKAAQLAARCLSRDPKARPLMSEVVEALKPLPNLKDMASSSYYFQTVRTERVSSSPNGKTG